jgi:hypothetical protein
MLMSSLRERRKSVTPLGRESETRTRDGVGWPSVEGPAFEQNPPRFERQETEQRSHRRGLAHPVPSEQGERLAPVEIEIDALQDLGAAVARDDRLDVRHHASTAGKPDRVALSPTLTLSSAAAP